MVNLLHRFQRRVLGCCEWNLLFAPKRSSFRIMTLRWIIVSSMEVWCKAGVHVWQASRECPSVNGALVHQQNNCATVFQPARGSANVLRAGRLSPWAKGSKLHSLAQLAAISCARGLRKEESSFRGRGLLLSETSSFAFSMGSGAESEGRQHCLLSCESLMARCRTRGWEKESDNRPPLRRQRPDFPACRRYRYARQ